jgi:uncharacterized membrane protein YhaH (DUF805 family)
MPRGLTFTLTTTGDMNWYIGVLRKYAVFTGRARRKEYWMFILFHIIIFVALSIIGNIAGLGGVGQLGLFSTLYMLAVLIPSLAVAVRRLHDTGRSGWWLFIALVPIIGAIVLLVFYATDGQPGDNQYGPNPKTGTPASGSEPAIA